MTLADDGFIEVGTSRLEYKMIGPRPGQAATFVLLHEGLGSVGIWGDFPVTTGLCSVSIHRKPLAVATAASSVASDPGEAKYTISQVMKKAHSGKGALLNKVTSGKASDAEGKELLTMYEALAKNKPPQGDAESWKKKTNALVEGAKLYVDGKKDDAKAKLNAAKNCKDCHQVHKG